MSSTATIQVTEPRNYINGAWRRSASAEFFEVSNPATSELIARTPMSSAADVDAAVQAAAEAFPAWRRTPPGERVQYLFRLKNLLEEHIDELSRLITLENGKTFGEAKAELRRGIENVEVACGIPMMMQGYNLEDVTPGVDEMQIRQPLGVVAAIVPFNFPAMIAYWFLPYAIACGNTFIVKPSERVPLSLCRAFELLEQTGLPKGVVNLVNGGKRRGERALRSSAGASDQLCWLHASRQARLHALGSRGQTRPMPGRREKSCHRPAGCGYGAGHANHQRQRFRVRGATVSRGFRRRHHWGRAENISRFDRARRRRAQSRQWP